MAPRKAANATHTAVRHIKHNGEYYAPGDSLALTDDQAESLGENVKPIQAAPKSSQPVASKNDTQAPIPEGDGKGEDGK